MKTLLTIITLNAATLASAAVIRNPDQWFGDRDSNKDGKISLGEFIDCQTGISRSQGKNWTVSSMKQRFQSLDKNGDNAIALNELHLQPEKKAPPKKSSARKSTVGKAKVFSVAAYHDFLGKNGKSFRGKVLAYDASRNIVTIQNDNNLTRKASPDLFSDADQAYFRDWHVAKGFNSDSRFKISAKRKQFKVDRKRHMNGYYGSENAKTTLEEVGYEITLENRVGSMLEEITVEYCIYYEQERMKRDKQITDEGVKHGTLHVERLAAKGSTVLKTDPVTLRKHELSADWFYYSGGENTQKGQVVGIWVRIHLPLSCGQQLTRQYSLPDSLKGKRAWSDHSIPIGMNRR